MHLRWDKVHLSHRTQKVSIRGLWPLIVFHCSLEWVSRLSKPCSAANDVCENCICHCVNLNAARSFRWSQDQHSCSGCGQWQTGQSCQNLRSILGLYRRRTNLELVSLISKTKIFQWIETFNTVLLMLSKMFLSRHCSLLKLQNDRWKRTHIGYHSRIRAPEWNLSHSIWSWRIFQRTESNYVLSPRRGQNILLASISTYCMYLHTVYGFLKFCKNCR